MSLTVIVLLAICVLVQSQYDFKARYSLTSPSFNQNRGRVDGDFYYSWTHGGVRYDGKIGEVNLYAVNSSATVETECNIFCPITIISTAYNSGTISYQVTRPKSFLGLWNNCVRYILLYIPDCVTPESSSIIIKSTDKCKLEIYQDGDRVCGQHEGIPQSNVVKIFCNKNFEEPVNVTMKSSSRDLAVITQSGMLGTSNVFNLRPTSCPQTVFSCAVPHEPKWTMKNITCGCGIEVPKMHQPRLFLDPTYYNSYFMDTDSNNCNRYTVKKSIQENQLSVTDLWVKSDNLTVCRALFRDGRDVTFYNVTKIKLDPSYFPTPNNTISNIGDYIEANALTLWQNKYFPSKPLSEWKPDWTCKCAKAVDITLILDITANFIDVELQRNFC